MKSKLLFAFVAMIMAFNSNASITYEQSTPLSKGHWAKISVVETGIYELTYDELRNMGFKNPENVKIFGRGGFPDSESFTMDYTDKLEINPIFHKNNKVYFYAKGVVQDSLVVSNSSKVVIPIQNSYSQYGYYFITDDASYSPVFISDLEQASFPLDGAIVDNGLTYWINEKDLYNPGLTGKVFLGDDYLKLGNQKTYKIPVPLFSNKGNVAVTSRFAMFGNQNMTIDVTMNGKDVTYEQTNVLYPNSYIEHLEYSMLPIKSWISAAELPTGLNEFDLNLKASIASGALMRCWEDYVTVSYYANNGVPADSAQTVRYFPMDAKSIISSKINDNIRIWLVGEAGYSSKSVYPVKNCASIPQNNGSSLFAFPYEKDWGKFIYFDLTKKQKSPKFEGIVANQNLHGAKTPNMLIITNSELRPAAERLAEFHRTNRGMDVLVMDQNTIFNEFSCGARSAMAYRSICKMFYQRDPNKFKYLLMMGNGSYDNRKLYSGEAGFDALMTYQSDESSSQVSSFMSDDFFAFLDDSKQLLKNQIQTIAVGRIPVNSLADADAYVDKVIKYFAETDAKKMNWKNNVFIIGEVGDNNAHISQSETFNDNLTASSSYALNISKLYTPAYKDVNDTRNRFVELLEYGQNFGIFIGHSNPISLTKSMVMLNMVQSEMTHYPITPFMYFSSCDVSRFDNGSPSFLSKLLLNPNGGIIAGLAAARPVYINMNGMLSNQFAKSMVKDETYYKGDKSIGRVFMDAKNCLMENSSNHLKYFVIGDPSIPLTLPSKHVYLTSVNTTDVSAGAHVNVGLGEKITLKGVVKDDNDAVNSNFNGTVAIKFFEPDYKYLYTKLRNPETGQTEDTQLYDRGKELLELNAKVVNGAFSVDAIVPPFSSATSGNLVLKMFAVDNDGTMCSGSDDCLTVDLSKNVEGSDVIAPTIDTMYIDNPNFEDGDITGSDFTVYADISDDSGILSSSESLLISTMKLIIDNGQTTVPVKNYYSTGSTTGYIEVPVYSIKDGKHTVELTVCDIYGNVSRETLSFIVESAKSTYEVEVEEKALITVANINVLKDNQLVDNAEIYVVDDSNKTYFHTTANSFPYEWNLCDDKGQKLAPGIYNVYAVIDGEGSPIKKIAILKQ